MSFHTSQTCRYLDLDVNRESGATYLLIVSVSSLSVSVALELELWKGRKVKIKTKTSASVSFTFTGKFVPTPKWSLLVS